MATCPCCGQGLPPTAEANELCPACNRAMDTGTDPEPAGSYRPREWPVPEPGLPRVAESSPAKRPFGVTILGWGSYITVGICLLSASVLFFEPLGLPEGVDVVSTRQERAWLAGTFVLLALVTYVVGRGLLKLREWGRTLTLMFSALVLVLAGSDSEIWTRAIALIIFWYLMQPHVRAAFDTSSQPAG